MIGAYDYQALGASVDFLSLMSYDDPDSEGPIARYSWLEQVLAHTLALVPAEKVSLGLGLYYWQWNDDTQKRVGIGGYEGIANVLNARPAVQHYSDQHQAPYLTYRKNGRPYVIWFENWQSVAKKIALIKKFGLHGFSAWALGLEMPSVFKVIGTDANL